MKDAAKCDKRCEWQNSANQENVERILHFWVIPESMSSSGLLAPYVANDALVRPLLIGIRSCALLTWLVVFQRVYRWRINPNDFLVGDDHASCFDLLVFSRKLGYYSPAIWVVQSSIFLYGMNLDKATR